MKHHKCKQIVQAERQKIATLLHDTLAQTLFSASTLSGVLSSATNLDSNELAETMLELNSLLKDAVVELKSIQMVLSDDDSRNLD